MSTYKDLKEHLELTEKYQLYKDDSITTWAEQELISYGLKQGHEVKGILRTTEMNANSDMVVFELNAYDKKEVASVPLKSGEQIYRYLTGNVRAGGMMPYVKINFDKGLVYYMTQESSSGETDEVNFEKKGSKMKYARIV